MKRLINFIEARTSGRYLKKSYPQAARDFKNIVADTRMGYPNLKIPLWKNADLMRILERYEPRCVCEFGSGTTTASFNAWVSLKSESRRGVTFESHPQWYRVVSNNIEFSNSYSYVLSDVDQHGDAASFHEKPWCFEPDFVYIDAPPIEGKVKYNSDFIWIIENQPLPRVFVVDVRYNTVVEMYKIFMRRGLNYKLYVSREFPVELLGADATYEVGKDVRHSIFELK
jgi:hypothetical protein